MALTLLAPTKGDIAAKADETGLRTEIIRIIKHTANNAPRNLQRHIGPSQVGTPCARELAYGLSDLTPNSDLHDPWPSIIGTAVHAWLADAMEAANPAPPAPKIWIPETRVDVGFGLRGSSDVFHVPTGCVCDWKGMALDTLVPVPNGWTAMGDLAVGDKVFSADGSACRVTRTYPETAGRDCYRVTFDDGSSFVTDDVQEMPVRFRTKDGYWMPFTVSVEHLAKRVDLVSNARVSTVGRGGPLVKSVTPVPSVTTRCIDVDSPDHLYLAGEAMIPVHNCLGDTTFRQYTTQGPSETYRTQAHCYGLGFARAGYEVKRVAIVFLGRAKRLSDLYIWSEPWDPEIALRALDRMLKIQEWLRRGNHPSTVPKTPGGACHWCSWKSSDQGRDGYCTGKSS